MHALGFPRNLGGPLVSTRWYCREKATERGGMGERESEYLILPVKQGNSPQGTLWREGGTEFTGLLGGKMAGTSSPITVSTGLRQIVRWVHDGDITLCSESVTRGAGCGSSARPDLPGDPGG